MRTAYARTRAPRSKKKSIIPHWLLVIAPLLAGILMTPVAAWAASILAMSGPQALRLLYPFVPVIQQHIATNEDAALAQWIMYGQFPAYGLIWMLMARLTRGSAGALSVVVLHCLGVAAAVLGSSAS
jgi:hypothetical protein